MMAHASKEVVSQRLDELESYWLQGASREQIISYFQQSLPLPGCTLCGANEKQEIASCTHGSPRWGSKQGKPISTRTIDWYLTRVRRRVSDSFSLEERSAHRALTLARLEKAYQHCASINNTKDMLPILRFMAQLNGALVSAEESLQPTLYERVRSMMHTCEDYVPTRLDGPPIDPQEGRFLLEKLEYLLLQTDDSLVDFRKQPKPKDDVQARLYLRNQTVNAIHQALTFPGLTLEARREALIKLSAAYGMIARDVDLAEQLDAVKKTIEDYKEHKNALSPQRQCN